LSFPPDDIEPREVADQPDRLAVGSTKRGKWYVPVAVEYVVGTKGDDVPSWQNVMGATLHYPTDIEVIGVQE
jgi:hypothetical protein